MGITSDKEIIQLTCGTDERYQEAFGVSLEEAAGYKTYTRKQALDWIGLRVSPSMQQEDRGQKLSTYDMAMQALGAMVLGHVPVKDLNFRPKCIYMATMARRVLMAMIDEATVDDRDYVGNKRLELYVFVSCYRNGRVSRSLPGVTDGHSGSSVHEARISCYGMSGRMVRATRYNTCGHDRRVRRKGADT